ncbi:MAG: ATP-binding protein [Salinivirgaceae bacterium]|nr:ATP-binding protein [Salinivirgaceae bacterium]MDD4747297.1 ATP-binding protein [Salinivirgaceae bacterium]MDY0280906.1 ATP-binding protein [Salinivirgaceae bacterium]
MIRRVLEEAIGLNVTSEGKAIILLGARQTGKTTLLKQILSTRTQVLWLNGDEMDTVALFNNASATRLRQFFSGYSIVVVDEAQRIENIGLRLKLITDQIPEIQVIATGSSAFELSNKINEPLTGRKWEYTLFPLSFQELVNENGLLEELRLLPQRLLYGCYPEVVSNPGKEKNILKQLTDSYLYKDILMWEQIKKPDKLLTLLQALAFQVGNEVSYNELGKLVGLDNQTVEKYIELLEKTFVIFRLTAFSRNLRKELKLGRKIYFYDNGIRNALIASFSLPELRADIGALWENYLVSERVKFLQYNNIWTNRYFWRTQDQQEIDYIEDLDGTLYAYEFKWNEKKVAKLSKTFANAYPQHSFETIHRGNYQDFLLPMVP